MSGHNTGPLGQGGQTRMPLVVATYRRFPLTGLLYSLLFLHAIILMVGGHYSYAEVPLGFWVRDAFDLARNHYDRLGHFAQGFIPAILAREILSRCSPEVVFRALAAAGGKPLAAVPGGLGLPRVQRLLRAHRMVGRARLRQ